VIVPMVTAGHRQGLIAQAIASKGCEHLIHFTAQVRYDREAKAVEFAHQFH